MIPRGHYLSSCYRKADIREFGWVWPFETSKWDFNLSTIGFFFFFLLQIWFLWKWGINTTKPDSMQINPCLHFATKAFNPCHTLQPEDCCNFTPQHLFSGGRRQICQRCCSDRGPSCRGCAGRRVQEEKGRGELGMRGWGRTGQSMVMEPKVGNTLEELLAFALPTLIPLLFL